MFKNSPIFVVMKFVIHKNTSYLVMGLALIVIFSRIIPHAPNFTGSIAAIIFSAVALRSWKAFVAVIFAYLVSDLIINNILYRQTEFMWMSNGIYWILLPFVFIYIINYFAINNEFKPFGIFTTALLSSTIFFLISNFGEWFTSKVMYTHDFNGLVLCYLNAIPFFGYELAGTLFYSSVIFSVYWLYFYVTPGYEYKK
jgi:hypothetical protein